MRFRLGRLLQGATLLLMVACMTGCFGGASGGTAEPGASAEAEIGDFLELYRQRTLAMDADGLVNMFTDPAVTIVHPFEPEPVTQTRAQLKAYLETGWEYIRYHRYDYELLRLTVDASGSSAVVEWNLSYETEIIGGPRQEVTGHVLWQLTRIGGQWFIARQETTLDLPSIPEFSELSTLTP